MRCDLRRFAVTLLVTLLIFPIGAAGSAGQFFEDVPDNHTFFADISWLSVAGITRGCNPPTNDRFCPDDSVTRGQMAAFISRAMGYSDEELLNPPKAKPAAHLRLRNFLGHSLKQRKAKAYNFLKSLRPERNG